MGGWNIVKISFNINDGLCLIIGSWVIIACIVVYITYLVFNRKILSKTLEFEGVEIGIGNHKIKLKPNQEDVQIAYKLWIEISTRKIGIPIDFENDVIAEVYNSWYEFFKITRELIKSIPISKIRVHDSTKELVDVAVAVLNEGMRPHLTRWQAKYRKWYEAEKNLSANLHKSPQDIQRSFTEYKSLTEDMGKVNKKLIKYSEILKTIAYGKY